MTIDGNFIIDGTYTSSFVTGQDLDFFGDTLGGIGTIAINSSNRSFVFGADAEILSGSQITVSGNVSIDNSRNCYQLRRTVSYQVILTGKTIHLRYGQMTSVLLLKQAALLMNTGILNASATDNTVKYVAQADQDITTPNGSTYFNLTITGSDTKTQLDNLTINNTLTISAGVLDCGN